MLPQLNITTEQKTPPRVGKSFLFDFNTGEPVLMGGKFVVIEGAEVIRQWVQFTLRTERFKYLIYQEHGVEIQEFIENQLPPKLLSIELQRTIREALEVHEYIQSISNFIFEREGSLLKIFFTVNLVDGSSLGGDIDVRKPE